MESSDNSEIQNKTNKWKNFNILAIKSLTLSVILVMLFEVVPTIGDFWYTAKTTRKEALDYSHQEALRLIQLVTNDHEQIVRNVRQLLSVLIEVPEIQNATPKVCSPFLAKLKKQYPLYSNLGFLDVEGNIICSAMPVPPDLKNLGDRLYFLRAKAEGGFAVGEFQVGRITKKQAINFGHALYDEDKKFKGVVFAALDLSWLQELANTAILPTQASLLLLDHQGKVLVSYPDKTKVVGKEIQEVELAKLIQSHVDQRVVETKGPDGVERMYALKRLQTTTRTGSMYLVVGVPQFVFYSQLEKALTNSMGREALVTFFEILFAWIAGFIFLYQIKKIHKAAKLLKTGDLSARTGLKKGFSELEYLAHTFDEMAENLEARTKEAEKEARRLSFLSQAATGLCTCSDYAETLQKIAKDAILTMADCCYIDIFDENGKLQRMGMAHVQSENLSLLKSMKLTPKNMSDSIFITHATPTKIQEELQDDSSDFDVINKMGVTSLIVMPIKIRDQDIGTAVFAYSISKRNFHRHDFLIAEDLAEYIALAIENSRLNHQQKMLQRFDAQPIEGTHMKMKIPFPRNVKDI